MVKRMKIDKIRFITYVLILSLVLVGTAGCSKKKEDIKDIDKVILTINDKDYTLQDIMYALYSVESQVSQDLSVMLSLGNTETDFWNEKDEETGKTTKDITKENVLKVAEDIIIQAQLAEKEGYVLSEEELDTVNEDVKTVLKNLEDKPDYLARTGFTTEKLTELVKQYNLAAKYVTDKVSEINIDKDSVSQNISPEDYAQVELEYILFWTGDVNLNSDYELFGPEKITEILKKAQAAYEEVESGADLIEVGEKYYSEEYTVEADTQPFFKNPEETGEDLYNAFKDLKVGELYPGVIETPDGYYIIRLVNDNCTTAYEEMLEEETQTAKIDAYDAKFADIKAGYTIQVHDENWANIEIGNYAFPKTELNSDTEFEYDEENLEEDSEDSGSDLIDDDGAVG